MDQNTLESITSLIATNVLETVGDVTATRTILDTALNVRDMLLYQKIKVFLESVDQVSEAQRSAMTHGLTAYVDESRLGKVFFAYIEKADSEKTAKHMGRALHCLGYGQISNEEFWHVFATLASLPVFALESLKKLDEHNYNSPFMQLFTAAGATTVSGGGISSLPQTVLVGRIPKILFAIRENKFPI